jgi:molecular chaperone DnaK
LVHSVEKNLKEHGDKLDDATKEEVTKALEEARKVESTAELDVLKEKVTALSNASMKIGQAIYAKKGDEAPAGGEASGEKKDNATDAEYEEKGKK